MNIMLSPNDLVLRVRKMEKTLSRHPNVEDAVLITTNTPSGEQKIKAFIEPGDPPPTEQSILEYCQSEWVDLPVPVELVFRHIPRTASGKVVRQQLLDS